MHFIEETYRGLGAELARARTHRIEDDGMPEVTRALSCGVHARDRTRVQRADVKAEPRRERGDLLRLLWVVRHDGARPDGEQDVRHIVDRDVVCDAVDQGRFAPYLRKDGGVHYAFLSNIRCARSASTSVIAIVGRVLPTGVSRVMRYR